MAEELFEALGLAVEAVKTDALEAAYRRARQQWFFRQYDPEFMVEAKDRLAQIEEAHRVLKDPRRQSALIREVRAARRQQVRAETHGSAAPDGKAAGPRAVHRPTIVRKLLDNARQMVLASKRDLNETEIQRIAREGLELGLEYADARELADRIAVQVKD